MSKKTYDRFVDFAMSRGAHASTPRGIALFQQYICAMLDKLAEGGSPHVPATGQRVFSGI
jgi:hypothetical protein